MSLQLIFGNSGSGKSYHLYKWVIEQSVKNPNKNYIVLVPEQFTMQTQKDLCEMHPQKGIMNIDVLSFVRLAHRIFGEIGIQPKQILDDEGKNLVLRKIAALYQDKLPVLRGNLKKQGYISEIKSIISEFTQYQIGIEELEFFIEQLDSDSYFAAKMKDIKTIYQGFEEYLSEKYITKEELLDVLNEVVPQSELLRNCVIVLDSFTGFTPVQSKLLGSLLSICPKVMVTVVMDVREKFAEYNSPYQLFALSKEMTADLYRIARERKVKIEQPISLYGEPVRRFVHNPPMAFLEKEIFRSSGKVYEKKQEAISIHEMRAPKEEAEYVVGEIRRLIREKGYRLKDIGVIVSNMETYASAFERAFSGYEIPFFMDNKKSILLNAFVEYLRSLIDMAEKNLTYESVFRFLRTGMTDFTAEELDKVENYVLATGIRGYKKWQEAWVRRPRYVREEDLEILNHIRVRFVEKMDGLLFVLKKKNKTVRDVTEALHEFLLRENMQEKIQRIAEMLQKEGNLALAKEYSQVYRIVIELFDKFVELLGDERISMREYAELLEAGLEAAKVGVIPPGIDQVVVGDIERTRLNNLKVLFFVGANDVHIPGMLLKGGILSEREREAFAEKKIKLSPGMKEKLYVQKFYMYLNLTKPSEFLYLTFSEMSAQGKGLRPAYIISDVLKMYPELHICQEEKRKLFEQELTWKNGAEYVAKGLANKGKGLSTEWKELYSWFQKDKTFREKMKTVVSAAFYGKQEEFLDEKTAKRLYGEEERFSITRMETFASCAYAHFLSYGLRLSERELYRFASVDLGNIAHQSLELFSKKAAEMNLDWTKIGEENRVEWIEQSVDESIAKSGNTILYSSARDAYMIVKIKRLIKRSVWALTKQLEDTDFRPNGYEIRFGHGKIDRLDTCEDEKGVYVKVTDYKTGQKAFDISAFYYGLQIQLPVYLNAAVEMEQKKNPGKQIIPAGMFYYRIQDPIVSKDTDQKKVETEIRKELKLSGLINGQDEVLEHIDKNLTGASLSVPLERKKDGEIGQRSQVLMPEAFALFLQYAKKKTKELSERISGGEVGASPYELGDMTGCKYCSYQAICRFDTVLDGFSYRELQKYDKEEIMRRIQNELEGQEER